MQSVNHKRDLLHPQEWGVTQYMCNTCYESIQAGPQVVSGQEVKASNDNRMVNLGENQYSLLTSVEDEDDDNNSEEGDDEADKTGEREEEIVNFEHEKRGN